jgi:heme exporter protein A
MFGIEVNNLAKRFGTRAVFSGIDFSLESGQSIAVVGANGSGKTTLLKTVLGLIPPSSGQAVFRQDGKKLEFDEFRRKATLIGPYLALYGPLTARENISFLSKINGYTVEDSFIDHVLEMVGLPGRGGDYVEEYSSGMIQRLRYALAMIRNPDFIFIDEPTVNLDDEGKKMAYGLIESFRPDAVMVIATNEKEEYALADSVCKLD